MQYYVSFFVHDILKDISYFFFYTQYKHLSAKLVLEF